MVESIGLIFLFPRSDFHNPRLSTSESNEHIYGNYRRVEREFTVERLLHLEDMNHRKTRAIFESNLKTDMSGCASGYQATYQEFVDAASNCEVECKTAGPVEVDNDSPCIDQLWGTTMGVVSQVNHSVFPAV